MNRTQLSKPDTWWRRLLRQPLTWGTVCLVVALPGFIDRSGIEPVPAILSVIGGALYGVGIQSAISGISSPVRSMIVHSAVAALFALQVLWVMGDLRERLDTLPDPIRGTLIMLNAASLPAAAWIWKALFARVIWAGETQLRRRFRQVRTTAHSAAQRRRGAMSSNLEHEELTASVHAEWEHDGDGCSTLRFAGVEMRLRTLTLAIVGTILSGSPFALALTIALANGIAGIRTREAIILTGALIGFLLFVLLMLILYRRTKACVITFCTNKLSVEVDTAKHTFLYQNLTLLRWVCDSEYARIVICSADGICLSVITGIARVPKKHSPELPPLPSRVVTWLEEAGLSVKKARRPGVTNLRRKTLRD